MFTPLSVINSYGDDYGGWVRVVGIGESGVSANKRLNKRLSLIDMGDNGGFEETECSKYICRPDDIGLWLMILMDDSKDSLEQVQEIISLHEDDPDTLIMPFCLVDFESLSEKIKSLSQLPVSTILIPKNINSGQTEESGLLAASAESFIRSWFTSIIAVDFADIRAVLNASKFMVCGFGEATGRDRAMIAVERAVMDLHRKGVNLNQSPAVFIDVCAHDLSIGETDLSIKHLIKNFNEHTDVCYSMCIDETAESYRVALFAAGS